MSMKDYSFRDLYEQVVFIRGGKLVDGIKDAFIEFQDYFPPADIDSCLCYCYIDPEAGLSFHFLCFANFDNESIDMNSYEVQVSAKTMNFFRFDSIYEFKKYTGDSLAFSERIQMVNTGYHGNKEVQATRDLTEIDHLRHEIFPDKIMALLIKDGLEVEYPWLQLSGIRDNELYGQLLNEPDQNFGVHSGDTARVLLDTYESTQPHIRQQLQMSYFVTVSAAESKVCAIVGELCDLTPRVSANIAALPNAPKLPPPAQEKTPLALILGIMVYPVAIIGILIFLMFFLPDRSYNNLGNGFIETDIDVTDLTPKPTDPLDYDFGYNIFDIDLPVPSPKPTDSLDYDLGNNFLDNDIDLTAPRPESTDPLVIRDGNSFYVQLSPEQAENFYDAMLFVLRRFESEPDSMNGLYTFFSASLTELHEDGRLYASFDGRLPHVLGSVTGQTGAVYSRLVERTNTHITFRVLSMLQGQMVGGMTGGWFEVEAHIQSEEMHILSFIPLGYEDLLPEQRPDIDFNESWAIAFPTYGRIPAFDDDGNLLQLYDWIRPGWMRGWEVSLDDYESEEFGFIVKDISPEYDYYLFFNIKDTDGNVASSTVHRIELDGLGSNSS